VGSGASRFQAGDRVALLSAHAFAEFDVAPEDSVVKLPDVLDGRPFPGEALGCALNVFRRCQVERGQRVAIVGIGFLGAVLTSLAAHAGARVLALSRRPFALQTARRLGAAEALSLEDLDRVRQRVQELTGGKGFPRVIEAVGQQESLDVASELTGERGRLIIAGYHQDGPRQVNLQQWNWHGIDVINAHERDPTVYTEGIGLAAAAVASGQLDPSPLYTHTFPLEQLGEALNALAQRPDGFLKALITL
jgi:threonine dehydrogenase-like Zn-dependent dehydrogenase